MTDPIVTLARWLGGQLEWMRHRAEVDEFLSDVERCARVVRGLARGPHEQKYLGPCGAPYLCDGIAVGDQGQPWAECGERVSHPAHELRVCDGDVYGPRGGSVGRCRVCGAEVATADREAWLDAQTRSEAFSARDIADAYRIPVKTLRNWANRGQLRTYWRTAAGLITPWTEPTIDKDLDDEERQEREDEIAFELAQRGPRLHYAGDVLDLATAAAVERAEREAARARRKDAAA